MFVSIFLPDDVLKKELRVTLTQYEKKYKKMGYVIEDEEMEEQVAEQEKDEDMENDVEYIDTIPLSDMNAQQLREYAKLHGIDLSGVKSAGAARKAIRDAIQKGM